VSRDAERWSWFDAGMRPSSWLHGLLVLAVCVLFVGAPRPASPSERSVVARGSAEANTGRIAIPGDVRPPRCQRLVEDVPGSEDAPSLPAGSWVRLQAIEGTLAEIEVGDASSREACEAGGEPRRLRIPFTALERPAVLAHDFLPRLGGEPLITVGRTGALSHAGRVLLPANPELQGVTESGAKLEHWTVFTGDPEAPYLFLFSGGTSDMYVVPPWAVLLGDAKPRPVRPGLGERTVSARLVEVTADGAVVQEAFYCFFQVRSTWTFHGGAMRRVSGDLLGREVELLAGESIGQLMGYSSAAGDEGVPLRHEKAPGKLVLRRFDFATGRMLVSWKGQERWVDWKALRTALSKSLYAQGGCGAG
jgi:hypothetical protein